VGDLYVSLRAGLDAFCQAHGEAALFIGAAALQVDAQLAPLPGLRAVTDRGSAMAALDTIVVQGEGAGAEEHDSHYCRFNRMAAEHDAHLLAKPAFEPAWPAATNPVMNPPPTPGASSATQLHCSRSAPWRLRCRSPPRPAPLRRPSST